MRQDQSQNPENVLAKKKGRKALRKAALIVAMGVDPKHHKNHKKASVVEKLSAKEKINSWLHKHYVHSVLNFLLISDLLLLAIGMNVELHYKDSIISDYKNACEGGGAEGECEFEGNHDLHTTELVIIYVSVVILTIFLMDNLGLLFANGIDFLRNPFCVMDLFVVVVSIYFELSHGSDSWVGFLVLGRTWRFVRIGHGIYELNHEQHEIHHSESNNNNSI